MGFIEVRERRSLVSLPARKSEWQTQETVGESLESVLNEFVVIARVANVKYIRCDRGPKSAAFHS